MPVEQAPRTRTITWADPAPALERVAGMSGLEYLQAVARGDIPLPPIASVMNFALAEVEQGRVVFTAMPGEEHYNPIGVVHAGLAATVLDSAMACAVHSTLPAGGAYTTLEIKVNFVRPITLDTGRVRCEGTLVHRGGTIATAEGRCVAEASGKLLAHATTTCMVMGRREGE
jgi:uncharacterized protein (TIGR00369 family)